MTFYQLFLNECIKHNTKPSYVADSIGMSRATISNWKNGGIPTDSVMVKLANYFGIDYQVVSGWKTEQLAGLAEEIGQKEKEHQQKIELHEDARSDLKLLFDMAMDATPQEVKSAIAFFEALRNGSNH